MSGIGAAQPTSPPGGAEQPVSSALPDDPRDLNDPWEWEFIRRQPEEGDNRLAIVVAPPPPPPAPQPEEDWTIYGFAPPPPPPAPQPEENWTIYGFIYTVTFCPGVTVVANIFLATNGWLRRASCEPEYPAEGRRTLVQFLWPDQPPGQWHGRWTTTSDPVALYIEFNGIHGPRGPLHGCFLHADRRTWRGVDYKMRTVVMELYEVWTVGFRNILARRDVESCNFGAWGYAPRRAVEL